MSIANDLLIKLTHHDDGQDPKSNGPYYPVFYLFNEMPTLKEDNTITDLIERLSDVDYLREFTGIEDLGYDEIYTRDPFDITSYNYFHYAFKMFVPNIPPLFEIDESFNHPDFIKLVTDKTKIKNFQLFCLDLEEDILAYKRKLIKKNDTVSDLNFIKDESLDEMHEFIFNNSNFNGIITIMDELICLDDEEIYPEDIDDCFTKPNNLLSFILYNLNRHNKTDYYVYKHVGTIG